MKALKVMSRQNTHGPDFWRTPSMKGARTGHSGGHANPAWRPAIWGGALGLAIGLTLWAPARWLAWGMAQASQDQVQWLDARGTLWDGSAQMVLSGGQGSRDALALPGRWHWTLRPTWLGLSMDWRADCCMRESARLTLQTGGANVLVRISNHTSQWPASVLTGWGAPWNTLQPDGQLQWRTQGLEMEGVQGRWRFKGMTELTLQNMSSRLSPIRPIGSYQLQLNGTPEGTPTPRLELSTLEGPLLLSGQGQWVGARLRFNGEARAQEGHEISLANLLNILGRRDGQRSRLSLG